MIKTIIYCNSRFLYNKKNILFDKTNIVQHYTAINQTCSLTFVSLNN